MLGLLYLTAAALGSANPAASPTAASVRKAGVLTCGIDQSEAEYSMSDDHGSRVAFDQDLCRAVAIAILGPHAPIALKGYPDNDTALKALKSGEVDLVASVSDDFSHNTVPGIGLTRPVLFDGQGFLVPRASGIVHAAGLDQKKICFLDETETELNLHAWFARHRLGFVPFPFQEQGEMEAAFVTGNCAALSGDLTRLANARAAFGPRAPEYLLLPETIAPDPLAMAYRNEDPAFGATLNTAIDVLLEAEEIGVTAGRVEAMKSSQEPATRRLLGMTHELAQPMGLEEGWTANVLKELGNYGEIFARDLGEGSPLKLPRGENALGEGPESTGLMYRIPLK
jgi:general L-amino acid transport system substrate-binding protein